MKDHVNRIYAQSHIEKLQLKIGGLHCSFCVNSIVKACRRIPGTADVKVSLAHEEVLVQYDPSEVNEIRIRDTIRQLGFTIRDADKTRTFEEEEAEIKREKHRLLLTASIAAIAIVLMVAMWTGYRHPGFKWAMMVLALVTVFGPGGFIIRMAFQSLRRGILNQHVLMEFAAFAGLAGGFTGFFVEGFPVKDFFAIAVFVTAYHILSGYVSLLVRTRSSQSVRKLLALQPPVARVVRNGLEEEVPIEEVRQGETVKIRPGDQIPLDGEVIEGMSSVDESLVTGESLPLEKGVGDQVVGGSMNYYGSMLIKVTHVGEETFLRQVARHIEEARALKPGIILLVERVLQYFAPGVLIFAAAGFFIWTLGAFLVTGQMDVSRAVFASMAVLVMGYPCALGMATPLAMIRGSGMAAEKGILMRSGAAFQALKDIRKVVFDKTGTITHGRPEVVDVVSLNGLEIDRMLKMAAAVENASEHPLARAIVEHVRTLGLPINKQSGFAAVPGKGASATVDGRTVRVGSLDFLAEAGVRTGTGPAAFRKLEEAGKTVVGVSADNEFAGLIALADTLKEDAKETVNRLQAMGLEPLMITGDNERTAQAVASQAGITEVMAQVLPDKKAQRIRELQAKGYRVAMVGDGINDAPALMQADVGIAIGAGTDIAIESADVILVGEKLGAIIDAYDIGINSYKKTVQNLVIAFSFNGIGIPLAATGILHPVWAMIAMAASVSAVLANSFGGRLLRKKES
ncbi:MAG: heavy metal translocating P-type ATPase, partial [bacterium]